MNGAGRSSGTATGRSTETIGRPAFRMSAGAPIEATRCTPPQQGCAGAPWWWHDAEDFWPQTDAGIRHRRALVHAMAEAMSKAEQQRNHLIVILPTVLYPHIATRATQFQVNTC